jgi:hypothetical protein
MKVRFTHPVLMILAAAALSATVSSLVLGQASKTESGEEEAPPSVSFLRGANLPVRSPSEDEFSAKTAEVAVETYRDEDFGTLNMMSSKGGMAVMPFPANYDIRTVPVGKGFQAIRFMPRLGSVWMMEDGNWAETEEQGDLFLGDYDLSIAVNAEDESMDIIRLEKITGTTWYLGKDGWVEIGEPE